MKVFRTILVLFVVVILSSFCRAQKNDDDTFLGKRYLTLNTVVRVSQIEYTRDTDNGWDESSIHTLAYAKAFREAIVAGWPEARITWAFSWQALFSEEGDYPAIREYARGCHAVYGDDVTFIPGGFFANAYNSREQINKDLHEALARVSEFMGNGFRPTSVVAGFLGDELLGDLPNRAHRPSRIPDGLAEGNPEEVARCRVHHPGGVRIAMEKGIQKQ